MGMLHSVALFWSSSAKRVAHAWRCGREGPCLCALGDGVGHGGGGV